MPTIQAAQTTIFYTENQSTGDNPLILIHGAGSSHLGWPPELRRFPHRRVVALDLPGHGRSTAPGLDSVSGYAEVLTAFLSAMQIDKPILVGHSMGSAIAQTIALQYPDLLAGMVLIGSSSKLTVNPAILEGIFTQPQETAAQINKWSWYKEADPALKELGLKALLDTPPHVIHGDYVACSQFDVTARLAEFTLPVLVIAASHDKMTPLEQGQALAENIVRARLEIIQEAGHMMMLEQPAEVSQRIQTWLQEGLAQ